MIDFVSPESQGFAKLINLLFRECVADMFDNCVDPELLVQFDLFIPEHQHVGIVSSSPS